MSNQTKSNSLTLLTIHKLNDRTLGFRYEMLEKLGLPNDCIFQDGTYEPISVTETKTIKVDIVAYSVVKSKLKTVAFIEIKAGIDEALQETQEEHSEYEEFAKKKGLTLCYIIPESYNHIDDLPKPRKSIVRLFWENILKMKSVRGTAFAREIIALADVDPNDSELPNKISLFSSNLTKILIEENVFHEPDVFAEPIPENITWFDIKKAENQKDEEISIGVSSDSGDVYWYFTDGYYNSNKTITLKSFGHVVKHTKESVYLKMSNIVDENDLSLDSEFMKNLTKLIKELKDIINK